MIVDVGYECFFVFEIFFNFEIYLFDFLIFFFVVVDGVI